MKVLVYGTGTMGKGICQVFAQNGHKVYLYNPNSKSSARALLSIENDLSKLVTKGKLSEENRNNYLKNIEIIDSIEKCSDVELAIEAVSENIEIKKDKFKEMDNCINREAIFATNTSSLSITELALATTRPDQVIGMHFFNPAPIMDLLEIINGMTTSLKTIDFAQNLSRELGKKPVLVEEAPGFIVNRMLIPMINEAVFIYSEGIATIEDIDTAMRSGANHPIGPLALADLIGLDICLNIMDILHNEFGLDKYAPHQLLRKMVRANKLGRKTKEGFYKY